MSLNGMLCGSLVPSVIFIATTNLHCQFISGISKAYRLFSHMKKVQEDEIWRKSNQAFPSFQLQLTVLIKHGHTTLLPSSVFYISGRAREKRNICQKQEDDKLPLSRETKLTWTIHCLGILTLRVYTLWVWTDRGPSFQFLCL